MRLETFFEKYLIDYEERSPGEFSDNYYIVKFYEDNFEEAMQAFANKLCEKQRENCADLYQIIYRGEYEPSTYEAIKDTAQQPNIYEL